ncbi:MAG: T9SS type A sorting domain-containing protein, partial [Candidatus Zixiibacteriota bacterium]
MALTEYNDLLIAAGFFEEIGGIQAFNIAAWNGTKWNTLDTGVVLSVNDMTEYKGELFICGPPRISGDITTSQIATWDGSAWSFFGTGTSSRTDLITCLTEFDNKLIVGGQFDTINGFSASGIASWDGYSWSTLGSGLNSTGPAVIYSMELFDNKLYVCGVFDSIGGICANKIACWDGFHWSPLGSGFSAMESYPFAIAEYGGQLIVGGRFKKVGALGANNIAAWNGQNWSVLGSGISVPSIYSDWYIPSIYALAVYNERLFVGGLFLTAGDKISLNIAMWTKKRNHQLPPKPITENAPSNFVLQQNYPNPFNPSTTIEYQLPQSTSVLLEIYNVLGQKVITLVDETQPAGLQRA